MDKIVSIEIGVFQLNVGNDCIGLSKFFVARLHMVNFERSAFAFTGIYTWHYRCFNLQFNISIEKIIFLIMS